MNKMNHYLYIITSQLFRRSHCYKFGYTSEPVGRRSTYLTGCPPGLTPCCDMMYSKIWKLNVTTEREGKNIETDVFNQFRKYRMLRDDRYTEWLQKETIETEIQSFLKTYTVWGRHIAEEIEIPTERPKKQSMLVATSYDSNMRIVVPDTVVLDTERSRIQKPMFDTMVEWEQSPVEAATVRAPCGFGKTVVTCNVLQTSKRKRIAVLAPNEQIQQQWGRHLGGNVVYIGGNQSVDDESLAKLATEERFLIVSTFASSKRLLELPLDICVFDEAHHMAGIVSDSEEEGEGITRVFLNACIERKLKRLFLTFTPRNVRSSDGSRVLSMDDQATFGKTIVNIDLRTLIQSGVLPDYHTWLLRSEERGLRAKAEEIVRVWNDNVIHHLLVFVQYIEDIAALEGLLQELLPEANYIYSINDSSNVASSIRLFESAPRSILINCRRLGEGVDIPIADSVAVIYPKRSLGAIIQTVLRAGRWYSGKALFHVLLCSSAEDDMDGFEDALIALAQHDSAISDELLDVRTYSGGGGTREAVGNEIGDSTNGRIHIEQLSTGSDVLTIRKAFQSKYRQYYSVRELCSKYEVTDTLAYAALRKEYPDLPERPWGTEFPFDYFNPGVQKITQDEFRKTYGTSSCLVTACHVNDGYFGRTDNLQLLLAPSSRGRR